MNSHVDRRFPNQLPAIEALAGKCSAFRAAIADYEEICTWLEAYNRTTDPHPDEVDHAQKIIHELEDEILSQLEVPDEHVRDHGNVK